MSFFIKPANFVHQYLQFCLNRLLALALVSLVERNSWESMNRRTLMKRSLEGRAVRRRMLSSKLTSSHRSPPEVSKRELRYRHLENMFRKALDLCCFCCRRNFSGHLAPRRRASVVRLLSCIHRQQGSLLCLATERDHRISVCNLQLLLEASISFGQDARALACFRFFLM